GGVVVRCSRQAADTPSGRIDADRDRTLDGYRPNAGAVLDDGTDVYEPQARGAEGYEPGFCGLKAIRHELGWTSGPRDRLAITAVDRHGRVGGVILRGHHRGAGQDASARSA